MFHRDDRMFVRPLATVLLLAAFAMPATVDAHSTNVPDFETFFAAFVLAVQEDRVEDYIDHIQFPLEDFAIEKNPDWKEGAKTPYSREVRKTITRDAFSPSLLVWNPETKHYPQPSRYSGIFAGPSEVVTMFGNSLYWKFGIVDGQWRLISTRGCRANYCTPGALLCNDLDWEPSFPGRGPDGKEDFNSFYEAFYCTIQHNTFRSSGMHEAVVGNPIYELLISRFRFPLRGHYREYDAEEETIYFVYEDKFHPGNLYGVDGGDAPPSLWVKGDTAGAATYSLGSDMCIGVEFTRIDGLWYATGLYC